MGSFHAVAALEAQGEYKLAIEVYRRLAQKGAAPELLRKADQRIAACQSALEKEGKP